MKRDFKKLLTGRVFTLQTDSRSFLLTVQLLLYLLISSILVLSGGCRGDLALTQNGAPAAKIVVSSDTSEFTRKAAEDLQYYLEKLTGATLPIVAPDDTAGTGLRKKIVLGRGAVHPKIQRAADKLDPDGFIISSGWRSIQITGSNGQGTLFGVYELLQRVGINFCWPGEKGIIIPAVSDLSLPRYSIIEEPDFPIREIRGGFGRVTKAEYDRFLPAFKLTTPHRSGVGHAYHRLIPNYLIEDKPGLFALVDGERRTTQLCTTNPDVIELVSRRIIDGLEKNPERSMRSICPNDGLGFCECERCIALDMELAEAAGDTAAMIAASLDPEIVQGSISNRLTVFNNEIAHRVTSKFPQATFGFYAYANYVNPPSAVPVHPALRIYLAHMPWDYCHFHPVSDTTCRMNSTFRSYLEGWNDASEGVVLREYWGHFAVWGPFPIHRAIAGDLEYYHQLGSISGAHSEWFDNWPMQWLNFHVAARLLWDTTTDVDGIVEKTCEGLFGHAGPEVAALFDTMAARCSSGAEPSGYGWLKAFASADFEFYFEALDKADQLLDTGEPLHGARERLNVLRRSLDLYRLWRETTYSRSEGRTEEALAKAGEFLARLYSLESDDPWFHEASSRVGLPRYERYLLRYIESGGDSSLKWRP